MQSNSLLKTASARSPYWDNYKGILIALVVFAHSLYSFISHDTIKYPVYGIYLFHMPAFVFASGYFSKSENSRSSRSILKLFSAYVLLTSVHMLMDAVSGGSLHIASPYYSAWYLLALIAWRLITPYFGKYKWSLPFFVVLSLLCGFWQDINNTFAVSRIISFYPFFLAGYYLSKEKTDRITSISPLKKLPLGIVIFTVAAAIAMYVALKLHVRMSDCLFYPYHKSSFSNVLIRICIFIIASSCIVALILLVPRFNIPILTKAGKNSLAIYLIHRPITIVLNRFVADFSAVYLLIYAVLFTLLCLALFGTDFVSKLLNSVLEFLTDGYLRSDEGGKTKKYLSTIAAFGLIILLLALPVFVKLIAG